MTRAILYFSVIIINFSLYSQSPAITSWLQNTTQTGFYYNSGSATKIANNILVNCQKVEYSATSVYVSTKGVPSYATGPFLDGNPSQATDQAAIFKFPLTPSQNTGTKTATSGGNIGVFINGVALFDYRDGVAWNNSTSALCGGPGNSPCPGGPMATQAWNRDAILAEKGGFDCAKGHPAMGNYHHHQNPSAFKLDKTVISTICNLYDADGLYVINETRHSPLIGFAYDGFPIYGAYGYQNPNGTGGIVRIKSGYQLKTMTSRTLGAPINSTYPLGYFREDYEYIAHPSDSSYLDEHNGRFSKTPEYPNGIYCYFATVDANHNSAYPYVIGPNFYGNVIASKVTSVGEPTTIYNKTSTNVISLGKKRIDFKITLSPTQDILAIQANDIILVNTSFELYGLNGKLIRTTNIYPGQTISYLDIQTVYNGIYVLKISTFTSSESKKIEINR